MKARNDTKEAVEHERLIDRAWIERYCLGFEGRLNNWVTRQTWWTKHGFDKQFRAIQSSGVPIQEYLWLAYHGQTKPPVCKTCESPVKFRQFHSGYHEYCSPRCATQGSDRNAKISKATIASTPVRLEKARITNLRKYGDSVYCRTADFKRKAFDTKLELYGCGNYNNIERRRQTCLKKYGKEEPLLLPPFQKRMQTAKLEKCSGEFFPGVSVHSKGEDEVREYMESVTGKPFPSAFGVLDHGLELDGYCPELSAAFEYCGLYWHSEDKKHRIYHRDKLEQCRQLGIRLFTIFEDEWLNRNHQVKNFLSSALGTYSKRIYARKCQVRIFNRLDKVSVAQAQAFLDNEHIQGSSGRSHTWVALEYANEMVGVMSFSDHHRQNHEGVLVLNRMAFKDGLQVVGGSSKMFHHALMHFGSDRDILSWSDNRWTEGSVYKKLGFDLGGETYTDYSYVGNKQNRIPKQSMQKKKTGCPVDVLEKDWCLQKYGLRRIWDCGKKRWLYHRNKKQWN